MFRQVKRWAAGNTKCLFNHPPSRQHPHLTMPLHVFLIRTVWWVSCYSSFQWYEYVMLMYIHWIEKNEIDWKLPACVSYNCFCCFHSKPLIFSLFYPIVKIQRKKKEKKYLRNYLIMMIFFFILLHLRLLLPVSPTNRAKKFNSLSICGVQNHSLDTRQNSVECRCWCDGIERRMVWMKTIIFIFCLSHKEHHCCLSIFRQC